MRRLRSHSGCYTPKRLSAEPHQGSQGSPPARREPYDLITQPLFRNQQGIAASGKSNPLELSFYRGDTTLGSRVWTRFRFCSITGDHSEQDRIWFVKCDKYTTFCVDRRSYLLWSPVIEYSSVNPGRTDCSPVLRTKHLRCEWHAIKESPHGRGCTFSAKGFWPIEFPK